MNNHPMMNLVKWEPVKEPAVDNDEKIPYATHTGTLEIGGIILDCVQLNTGERLITEESFDRAFPGWKEALSAKVNESQTK